MEFKSVEKLSKIIPNIEKLNNISKNSNIDDRKMMQKSVETINQTIKTKPIKKFMNEFLIEYSKIIDLKNVMVDETKRIENFQILLASLTRKHSDDISLELSNWDMFRIGGKLPITNSTLKEKRVDSSPVNNDGKTSNIIIKPKSNNLSRQASGVVPLLERDLSKYGTIKRKNKRAQSYM